jgi:hypothetical protein
MIKLTPEHNAFRAADAFECTDRYRTAFKKTPNQIRERLAILDRHIQACIPANEEVPSFPLAACRAYEDALSFIESKIAPTTVTLDQSEPDCGVLFTGGCRSDPPEDRLDAPLGPLRPACRVIGT